MSDSVSNIYQNVWTNYIQYILYMRKYTEKIAFSQNWLIKLNDLAK